MQTAERIAELRHASEQATAAVRALAEQQKKDMARALRAERRASDAVRDAVDMGHGTFWSTDTGRWEPRLEPITVAVRVDSTTLAHEREAKARAAYRRLWGVDPIPELTHKQTSGCCPRCCDPVEYVVCRDPECPIPATAQEDHRG